MRWIFALGSVLVLGFFTGFWALMSQAQSAENEILSTTTTIDVVGKPVSVPISLLAQTTDEGSQLAITALAKMNAVLGAIGPVMESAVDERHRGCRERWDGSNGVARIDGDVLFVAVTIRVEKWVCEDLLVDELKTRIGRETARLKARLRPRVVDGAIRIEMSTLEIENLSQLAQEFGVEKMLRDALQKELDEFNQDPERTRLPQELSDIGFSYHDIQLQGGEQATARVSIIGPNDTVAVLIALHNLG